jgi:hypothetical protein
MTQAPLGVNAPALLSLSLLARHVMAEPIDFSCNYLADTCPWIGDGECDSQFDLCEGGDCYDCDQCQQFHYDCNACISNGCYYCPGDALCFNSPYYSFNVFSHCAESNDYTQETCSEPGNFFRYVRIYDPNLEEASAAYCICNLTNVLFSVIVIQCIPVRNGCLI